MNTSLTALQIAKWNAIVPKSYIFQWEGSTHFVFLHPTKGFRPISKKRLGL